MGVIVNKVDNKKHEFLYPFIGICSERGNEVIVLFSKENTGTVIFSNCNNDHEIGDYADNWYMNSFTKYNGKITLEN